MELLNNGITIKDKVEGVLTGKSFCFTGTQVLKRAVLENIVLEKGGIVKNTCSKGTTYLVIADPNSTSTKATAAKKLGVTLITGEEFMQMAGENIEDYLEE
jgi:NAD-dependent DNA ligase